MSDPARRLQGEIVGIEPTKGTADYVDMVKLEVDLPQVEGVDPESENSITQLDDTVVSSHAPTAVKASTLLSFEGKNVSANASMIA